MKTFMIASIFAATIATAAAADDFDNNTFEVTLNSGALDFALDADEAGLTDFEVGVSGLAHKVGAANANVRGAFTYNLDADTIGIRGEYNVWGNIAAKTDAYGTAAVEYKTVETDLSNGDFFFDPSVGIQYIINEKVAVFGEVGYTWNMDDDWSKEGGYVEIGLPVTVARDVTITPSLIRGIDDGAEETNMNVALALAF